MANNIIKDITQLLNTIHESIQSIGYRQIVEYKCLNVLTSKSEMMKSDSDNPT